MDPPPTLSPCLLVWFRWKYYCISQSSWVKISKQYIKLRIFYYIQIVIFCKLGLRKLFEICLNLINFSHFLHLNEYVIFSWVLGFKYGYRTRNEIFLQFYLVKNVQNGDAQGQKQPKLKELTKSPFWIFFKKIFMEF